MNLIRGVSNTGVYLRRNTFNSNY